MAAPSFAVRFPEEEASVLTRFSELAEEQGTSRESLARNLIARYVERADADEEEQYYTIKGYSDDHKRDAYIHNMDRNVTWDSNGIEWKSHEWKLLEHAVDLVERGEPGDKEAATKLFQDIFGERNVFVKDE